jgi:hypothetical protein
MFRVVLKLGLAAAAIWAVWSFVPVRDRTLAERWHAAGSLPAFLERAWAEATAAVAPRPQARSRARAAARERPAEAHTEADRRAVDRILSERLSDRR